MPQSIGIFGGTFDPVHNGHVRIAEAARNQFSLDLVIFVPNSRSPLKSNRPSASFHDRVAMLRLATGGCGAFEVSEIEGRRGGTSYTIDTLREFNDLYTGASFILIVGSDALREFHLWRESGEIRKLARLAYIERPGSPIESGEFDAVRIDMTPTDVSSTVVRDRVQRGMPIDTLVPAEVASFISAHHHYEPRPRPQS